MRRFVTNWLVVFCLLLIVTSGVFAAEEEAFNSSQLTGTWEHSVKGGNGKVSKHILQAKHNKAGELIFGLSKHSYSYEPVFVGWAVYFDEIEVYFKLKSGYAKAKKAPYSFKYVLSGSEKGLKGVLRFSWAKELEVTLDKTAEAVEAPAVDSEAAVSVQANGVTEKGKFILGQPCPPIRFKSIKNRPVKLGEMKGKVVLVDFWATWCGPCVKEMPTVIKAYDDLHDDGLEIIGISLDKEAGKLRGYVQENKMGWEQFFDGKGWNNKYAKFYGIRSIPTTILVDKKGVIRYIDLRGENLITAIEVLLSE